MWINLIFLINVGRKLIEYEAFILFHNKINKVLCDKRFTPHFVSAKIISLNDVRHISNLPDNQRATCLLKSISGPIENGDTQNFYKLLEIMRDHGNPDAQKLVEDIKAFIGRNDPSIRSTETAAAPTKGKVISNGICFNG